MDKVIDSHGGTPQVLTSVAIANNDMSHLILAMFTLLLCKLVARE